MQKFLAVVGRPRCNPYHSNQIATLLVLGVIYDRCITETPRDNQSDLGIFINFQATAIIPVLSKISTATLKLLASINGQQYQLYLSLECRISFPSEMYVYYSAICRNIKDSVPPGVAPIHTVMIGSRHSAQQYL